MTGKRPFYELKHGRVKATIWNDTHQGRIRFNVAFTRLCNDAERWWGSAYFQRDDMPSLIRVAEDAQLWIGQQAQRKGQAEGEGGDGTS